jgi:1-acyl-sn-glycerol-3-phosphate acyltransferase
MIFLRSLIFLLLKAVMTVPFSLITLMTFPLPAMTRYRVISQWSWIVNWLARVTVGITYRVEGLENLPAEPVVILSKHQSAWETIVFQQIFPPLSFVLKKNLLYIPFFGWGLALFSPIAIDRGAGREALKQIETQGKQRLKDGFWVLIFPEGTRMPPGESGNFQVGGAWLAGKAGVPVLPVAHNAGRFWPKNGFRKYPGEIVVRIGPPIPTVGRKATQVMAESEAWIKQAMLDL